MFKQIYCNRPGGTIMNSIQTVQVIGSFAITQLFYAVVISQKQMKFEIK